MTTVLVIGASRGLGREFVRQYAAEGAHAIGTARSPAGQAAVREAGGEALPLDVLDTAAVEALPAQLGERAIDVVVVNAGVYGPRAGALTAPGDADFDLVMRTNVRAPMQLVSALAPVLTASRARLAVVSSRMGSLSLMSSSAGWLYRASKAGTELGAEVGEPRTRPARRDLRRLPPGLGAHRHGWRRRGHRRRNQRRRHAARAGLRQRLAQRQVPELQRRTTLMVIA